MKRRAIIVGTASLVLLGGCFSSDDSVDASGTMEITIDGSAIDLTRDRYQAEHSENHSVDFHLHDGSDEWFMEGDQRVTFAEAIDLLPYFSFSTEDGTHVLEHDGTTYDEADGETDIIASVDDTEVEPDEYTLEDGDEMRLEVTTGG